MHFRASWSPQNAESGEGLCPFEPRIKGGTPPFKNPPVARSIYFSGEGAAKNSGFFQVIWIKLDLTFLEHFSHYLWRLQ